MSPIDFHLSMPYHYTTKLHFPTFDSKSLSIFYVFYIILYSLLKTTSYRLFRKLRYQRTFVYLHEHLFSETEK